MTKANSSAPRTPTQPREGDAPTPALAKATRPRPTDAALRPSTPTALLVSRMIDQELDWFFVYAETALSRESVGLLPSYASVPVPSLNPTEDVLRIKARGLAQTVQRCLREIRSRHASVLRCVYTPRRWPKNVEAEFQTLAPVVIRCAVARDPWPARSAHAGLEDAAATRLSARLLTGKPLAVARLKAQARGLLRNAVLAYARVRSLDDSQPLSLG
jgi:hypothetical protein